MAKYWIQTTLTFLLSSSLLIFGSVDHLDTRANQEYEIADLMTLKNDYTIKLVGCDTKETTYAGRLELLYQGTWGTICGDTFDDKAASVACYSLGYHRDDNGQSRSIFVRNAYGGPENKVILLKGLRCNGTESHLDHCEHFHYGDVWGCDHNMDVYVACEPRLNSRGEDILGYDTRLCQTDGDSCSVTSISEGRLEIYYDGQWGTVCDYKFQNVSARVACQYMITAQIPDHRYRVDGWMTNGTLRATDARPIWLGWVECDGSELNLGSCPHAAWGTRTCNHNDDVNIKCSYTTATGRIVSEQELSEEIARSRTANRKKSNMQHITRDKKYPST